MTNLAASTPHVQGCSGVWQLTGKFFGLSLFRCFTCHRTRTLEF